MKRVEKMSLRTIKKPFDVQSTARTKNYLDSKFEIKNKMGKEKVNVMTSLKGKFPIMCFKILICFNPKILCLTITYI